MVSTMRAFKEKPSSEKLNELFSYSCGKLFYNPKKVAAGADKRFNTMFAGKEAGSKKDDGYVMISINKELFSRSHLVFIMHNGEIPDGFEIDHIDTNRSNDNFENLRLATRVQQEYNKPVLKEKKSKLPKGVIVNGKGFIAKIRYQGKRFSLGTFPTPLLASIAYNEASKKYHGEFSNTN